MQAAAEPLLRRALAIQRQGADADDPETASRCGTSRRTSARSAASRKRKRSRARRWNFGSAAWGTEHEWTAWGLDLLSPKCDWRADAPTKPSTVRERAARILERLFGGGHAVLGTTLYLEGRALFAAGRPGDAETTLAKALHIQRDLGARAREAAEATRRLLERCREPRGDLDLQEGGESTTAGLPSP